MKITISDDFFTEEDYKKVVHFCKTAKYTYGEVDNESTPPTGMVSEIPVESEIYSLFADTIQNKYEKLLPDNIYRMYVNCFAPSENPFFHTDGESGITALYYPTEEWNIQEGGETQFLTDENLCGVLPIPNRMVLFDAPIPHRATPFRSQHRFTIAVKYR